MASGEAFITSAPETVAPGSSFISHCAIDDTESIASGSTTMPNLNLLAGAWAEFNMRGVSDREVRARQTTDFFEQLRTAGLLDPNSELPPGMRQDTSSTSLWRGGQNGTELVLTNALPLRLMYAQNMSST